MGREATWRELEVLQHRPKREASWLSSQLEITTDATGSRRYTD